MSKDDIAAEENPKMSHVREVEERTLEYQRNFSFDRFRVVRKELFAHLRDPAMTIRTDGVSFNTACIEKLENVVYIKMSIDHIAKHLIIEKSDADYKDSLRWCVEKKDGTRKSRKIIGREFAKMVYNLMGWDRKKRYKIIGFKINAEGRDLFLFDLNMTEIFDAVGGKKTKTLDEAVHSEVAKVDVNQTAGAEKVNMSGNGTMTEVGLMNEVMKLTEAVKTPPRSMLSEKITSTFGITKEEELARQNLDLSRFTEVKSE